MHSAEAAIPVRHRGLRRCCTLRELAPSAVRAPMPETKASLTPFGSRIDQPLHQLLEHGKLILQVGDCALQGVDAIVIPLI